VAKPRKRPGKPAKPAPRVTSKRAAKPKRVAKSKRAASPVARAKALKPQRKAALRGPLDTAAPRNGLAHSGPSGRVDASVFSVFGERDAFRGSPESAGVPTEILLRMYRTMVLLRTLDAKMLLLQRQGRIGFWGPTKGQEAATIGSCAAFEDRDWILPALREAGCALYRGFSLTEMVSQCLGNSGDKTQGRQMPCHYTFKAGNYVAMSSVIGTQIPHAVGVAMAAKTRGEAVVAAGYLGDGATSSTDFHAAMNLAAVRKAPVVIICQNNQWAISVPLCKQMATKTIAEKAIAYGMAHERVDGNDVLAVYVATKRAVDRARRGEGPTFLELLTYRVLGHSSSDDPSRYRDEAEVKYWEGRDPIARCRAYLERTRLWDAVKEEDLDGELQAKIAQAVREAEAMPPVAVDSLVEDVYRTTPPQLLEQLENAKRDL
jgi:pyruvate dehydrogenase E1 component alpha subunit